MARYFSLNEAKGDVEEEQNGLKFNQPSKPKQLKSKIVLSDDEEVDPYIGSAPVNATTKKKYCRGKFSDTDRFQNAKLYSRLQKSQAEELTSVRQAARHELLLTEEAGFIEVEEGEETWKITQDDIVDASDIATGNKKFELRLDFGPYRIDYTNNGRYLLLGGKMGHIATFDWVSKELRCEMNVMEAVRDVKWLHSENMFAVAQKKWVYIYDNMGVELHCVKNLVNSIHLDFLPYHFLLVSGNAWGLLQYLDISVGKLISSIKTKQGRVTALSHNPSNGVVLVGHCDGTIAMYTPNQEEAVVKMLCHKSPTRDLAVDKHGNYVATSGSDGCVRIFDLRNYKLLYSYGVMGGASNLEFSQRGLLAACRGDVVEIYKDPCVQKQEKPYLSFRLDQDAQDLMFCPYEDVLGVGCSEGFVSMLVPGSGEANYDTMASNPYRMKKERQEWEVKALLEKIQPDLISLDPTQLTKIDHVTADQLEKDRIERLGYTPEPYKFVPRSKKKGKSKSSNIERRKSLVRGAKDREKIAEARKEKIQSTKKKAKGPKKSAKQSVKDNSKVISVSAKKPPDATKSTSAPTLSVLGRFAKKRA